MDETLGFLSGSSTEMNEWSCVLNSSKISSTFFATAGIAGVAVGSGITDANTWWEEEEAGVCGVELAGSAICEVVGEDADANACGGGFTSFP